jgi:hypothetical protein
MPTSQTAPPPAVIPSATTAMPPALGTTPTPGLLGRSDQVHDGTASPIQQLNGGRISKEHGGKQPAHRQCTTTSGEDLPAMRKRTWRTLP